MIFNQLLAIDIGAGTQDILLYDKDKYIENCIKMILPSYASILYERIKKATEEGKNIFLYGGIMGGHPLSSAVKRHIKAGYKVYSTMEAARTFRDNIEEVKSWGLDIVEESPKNCLEMELTDLNLEILADSLSHYSVKLPDIVAIAVQDHGECIEGSNRKFRFSHWKKFLKKGGSLKELVYREPPPYFTRMVSIKKSVKENTFFMDTGPAGIMGAFCDPFVEKHKNTGVVIVNIGNQHFIAYAVKKDKIFAILEHHTREMDEKKVIETIEKFKFKALRDDEVFNDRGHGVSYSEDLKDNISEWPVIITGPKRQIAKSNDYYFAVPNGDMMLTGCFGLIEGLKIL